MEQVRLQRLHTTRTLKYLPHTSVWPSPAEDANHLRGKLDEEGQQVLKKKNGPNLSVFSIKPLRLYQVCQLLVGSNTEKLIFFYFYYHI